MGWTFYNSSGQQLSTSVTSISVLDIDGATDIGADIVDADLFIIDDGAGGTNRKTAASRVKTYAATTQAVQSDIEAETNQDTYIPPDLMKHHPGVAKVWCQVTQDGTLASPDYGVASITDTDTGNRTIVFTTAFSSIVYSAQGIVCGGSTSSQGVEYPPAASFATGSIQFDVINHESNTLVDEVSCNAIFGDQ